MLETGGLSRFLLGGLHAWLSPADQARAADLIFVLAGQMSRKEYALQLFREGLAPRLLFSVDRFEIRRFSKMALPTGLDLLKLAQEMPPPRRHYFVLFHGGECQVEHVQPQRFGTLMEIATLADWLRAHPEVQSVMVISNESHLRRSRMCCRALLPSGVEVRLVGVPHSCADAAGPPSSAIQATRGDLLEFFKVFVYGILLSLQHSPRRR